MQESKRHYLVSDRGDCPCYGGLALLHARRISARFLEQHGLTHLLDAPGMAADLTTLNEDLLAPSGLVIQKVGDIDGLKKYADVFTAGFDVTEPVGQGYFALFTSLGFAPSGSWRHYVGSLDREPVSCSSLFLGAGVAGIYCVTTVLEARRKGMGTAVTLAPLREAREMGYRVGILHSEPPAEGVYRRLGFRECCKVGWYALTGEANDSGELGKET